jgi:hypothetical protein
MTRAEEVLLMIEELPEEVYNSVTVINAQANIKRSIKEIEEGIITKEDHKVCVKRWFLNIGELDQV